MFLPDFERRQELRQAVLHVLGAEVGPLGVFHHLDQGRAGGEFGVDWAGAVLAQGFQFGDLLIVLRKLNGRVGVSMGGSLPDGLHHLFDNGSAV
jgi:hypothetical protein